MMRKPLLLLLTFQLIYLTSCSYAPTAAELAGEYAYQYKTGEVEVVEIRADLSYVHELFLNGDIYRKQGKPAFRESGAYSIDHREVTAMNWRMLYDMLNPGNRLKKTYVMKKFQFTWIPSDSKVDAVLLYTDDGYYFRRMKDRNGVIE